MVNQRDVAKLAGVSSATVSRLINNKGYISPELKTKVYKAIKDLNYRPNLVARSLKIRSTNTIGMIFPDIENTFFVGLIKKAEEVAFKKGYNIILCNTDNNPKNEKTYIDVLKGKLVDGYIIITSFKNKEYLENEVRGEKVVFLDRSLGIDGEVLVKLNNIKGIMLAMEHLIDLGHTRIGLVNVTTDITTGYERYEGYKKALSGNGIKLNEELVKFCGFDIESGYKKTYEFLSGSKKPSAIITISNRITIGALKAIKKLKLSIPGDISIVGFDELKTSELFNPPLTTVAQPAYEFGEIGIETLIKMIKGRKILRRTIILEPELMIRESTKKIVY